MSESVFLTNQKKINGRLCQVDWRLISALREVVEALKAPAEYPVDLAKLVSLIDAADDISKTVAIPDPPGCQPVKREAAPES